MDAERLSLGLLGDLLKVGVKMNIYGENVAHEIDNWGGVLRLAIDDGSNLCTDNNYNGDYTVIELNREKAKELVNYISKWLGDSGA